MENGIDLLSKRFLNENYIIGNIHISSEQCKTITIKIGDSYNIFKVDKHFAYFNSVVKYIKILQFFLFRSFIDFYGFMPKGYVKNRGTEIYTFYLNHYINEKIMADVFWGGKSFVGDKI